MRISDWSSDVCASDLTNRPSGSGLNITTASVPPSSTTNGTANVSTLPASLDNVKYSGDTGRLITKASVCSLRSTTRGVEMEKHDAETIKSSRISEPTWKDHGLARSRKSKARSEEHTAELQTIMRISND